MDACAVVAWKAILYAVPMKDGVSLSRFPMPCCPTGWKANWTSSQAMSTPKAKMWTTLVTGFVVIGFTLFISAGTILYWQAWVFLGIGALSSILLTLHVIKD